VKNKDSCPFALSGMLFFLIEACASILVYGGLSFLFTLMRVYDFSLPRLACTANDGQDAFSYKTIVHLLGAVTPHITL